MEASSGARAAGDGQIVTLALVKQYLKIEHDAEDVLISTLIIPAAEAYAIWYTRRPAEVCRMLPTVAMAVCTACGGLLLNREWQSQGRPYEGNPAVDAMLWAYRDLCSDGCEPVPTPYGAQLVAPVPPLPAGTPAFVSAPIPEGSPPAVVAVVLPEVR